MRKYFAFNLFLVFIAIILLGCQMISCHKEDKIYLNGKTGGPNEG